MLVWASSSPSPLLAVCGTEEFTHVLSALALPERATAMILLGSVGLSSEPTDLSTFSKSASKECASGWDRGELCLPTPSSF